MWRNDAWIPLAAAALLVTGCGTDEPVADAEDDSSAAADGTDADTNVEEPDATAHRLPDVAGVDGDCDPLNMVDTVPLASWMEVADGVLVGTVTAIRPVSTPLGRVRSEQVDSEDCLRTTYALDVDLTDVAGFGEFAPGDVTTVRLGSGTWFWWMTYPLVSEDGSSVEQWNLDGVISDTGPLQVGMRLGGAVYASDYTELPVWAATAREPLFEMIDGVAHFQTVAPAECDYPELTLDGLDGLSEAELLARFASPGEASAAATADYTEVIDLWQEWVKFAGALCDEVAANR